MHATVGALLLAVTVPAATARAGTAAPAADPVKVLATIPFGGSGPLAIAVSPLTDEAYVIEVSQVGTVDRQTVVVISGKTNKVITSIPGNFYVGGPASISPKTDDIYLASGQSVTVLNGKTNKIVTTIPLGSSGVPGNPRGAGDIAVDPVSGDVYVSGGDEYSVGKGNFPVGAFLTVINGKTSKPIATFPNWGAAAISPKTGEIYAPVAEASDNAYTTGVAVLNGTTSKLIGTIKFPAGGIGPGPATVNPVTGAIYIPYTNDDLVTNEEVFGATNKLTGSIDVDGPVASVAAISPKTGDVYVMTGSAADAIVAVIAG